MWQPPAQNATAETGCKHQRRLSGRQHLARLRDRRRPVVARQRLQPQLRHQVQVARLRQIALGQGVLLLGVLLAFLCKAVILEALW
jgi:hypothetical protein